MTLISARRHFIWRRADAELKKRSTGPLSALRLEDCASESTDLQIYHRAICILREPLVVLPRARPNAVLVMVLPAAAPLSGNPNDGVLVAFCISRRYSRFWFSVMRILLPTDRFKLKNPGVVKKFLPVLPRVPGSGMRYPTGVGCRNESRSTVARSK